MRFEQQISAYSRPAAITALIICLFASGRPVSASGQVAGAPQTPTPGQAAVIGAQGPLLQITADEAVKMALENNLGIQAQRLSPQIQALLLSQTRATYAPLLFTTTTKNSNSSPPSNFLEGNDFTTSAGVRNSSGVQQLLKWGGGRYTVSMDGSRNTTSVRTDAFNPRLSSNFNFNFNQPLLRDFSIDSTRQQLLLGQKQQEIVDVQLQQQVTQTARAVRFAYFDLVGAIGQFEVSRKSLELANESLRNNQKRLEVGTIPPIDIVEAQAEVSRNEESVIINEARIKSLEDVLRTLIMNPSQQDYWTARITPSEQPVLTPQTVDVEGAIRNALDKRTDLIQARKQLEQTDIGIKFLRNQRLPGINAIVNYGLAGVGGTNTIYEEVEGGFPRPVGVVQRSFGDTLRNIFGNDFKTWSVQVQVTYPIGMSQAEAGLAQGRVQRQQDVTNLRALELQITAAVRDAARQVDTTLKRVEATRQARQFAERRYEAEQKRMTVGLSTTFQLFQAQRDLSQQQLAENNAVIAYNLALVNFEAAQLVPVNGR